MAQCPGSRSPEGRAHQRTAQSLTPARRYSWSLRRSNSRCFIFHWQAQLRSRGAPFSFHTHLGCEATRVGAASLEQHIARLEVAVHQGSHTVDVVHARRHLLCRAQQGPLQARWTIAVGTSAGRSRRLLHTERSMLGWLVSHTLNVTEGLTARFSAKLAYIGQRVVWGAGEGARLDGSC